MPDPVSFAPLERAVDAFDAMTVQRGWDRPPLLLRTERGVDPSAGAHLGFRELDGHPSESLLGFSAPLAWTAIGVSAEGWATQMTPTGAASEQHRVRSIVLVDRDGDVAGRLRRQDGSVIDEAPAEGLILDCLMRALGRRTPPPTQATALLFASLWLSNIVTAARRRRCQVGWPRAVTFHPAVQVLARDGERIPPGRLVEASKALSRVCDWAMVRHQVIAGWRPVDIDPQVAVWMDTGMLARWLLDRLPAIDDLLDALARTCPPVAQRHIRASLDAMGVTTADSHPDVA